jgi:acyl-coenzyme A thioesterase PaaI-like protein
MQIAAVRSGLGAKSMHLPTISLSVDYLAPVSVNSWVEAAVTLTKATRTLMFTQAVITADGDVFAPSTAIYRNRVKDAAPAPGV